ncbi:SRPBCC family protein [Pseudomonas sp. ZM23]|uniref:SRPBCC family protein n=1 Tax=Pseudomonas triclosanedens TaxID=2961893 RepID=A0ABY6ZVE9_9PSED|nr:SRPBCC family protein [Pseudomonas triclosanedens]MCP8465319.1 SRPBCC family protein [Pseudomonas triclosanedens]MCP8470741.1 SRPBCC family protein [Pseudomonas triclosanedens]MCP8476618.1 SRPBCC family protein [Pseudomonas triclosanedens]WAI48927.1 SRPBCC family protein [Pseudomonas triclosanedens]
MTTMPSRTLSVRIERRWSEAYEFLAAPENFPRWASGLCSAIEPLQDDLWLARTPQGALRVRFSPRNPFGVLDHDVLPDDAPAIHIPLRLIVNRDGCELQLTLLRQPEMDDATFERDAQWVMKDLQAIKTLLEA